MLCIVLLLSINQVYAQGKGVFFFFDEDSEETYYPEYSEDIFMEGDPGYKAYGERKVKNGIWFKIGNYMLFHRDGMQQKKVDTTFLKGEKILNATQVAQFLNYVGNEKAKKFEREKGVKLGTFKPGGLPEFVYRPDPPMYIVKKIQEGYLLYEVEWENEWEEY